jgi:hypothetical protein
MTNSERDDVVNTLNISTKKVENMHVKDCELDGSSLLLASAPIQQLVVLMAHSKRKAIAEEQGLLVRPN